MGGRIGVLGGTFDPIHQGHLDLGAVAREALDLATILVVPSNIPPHRAQPEASSHHRFAMAALAVTGRRGWRLSDLELQDPAPSYTSTTLRRLREDGREPRDQVFIIGADAFADIETWHDYPAIFELAHFAVVSRPGHPAESLTRRLPALADRMTTAAADRMAARATMIFLIDRPTADVSSTAIRARLARGEPIGGLVPDPVLQYIEQQQLYTNAPRRGQAAGARPDVAAGRLHGQN